jgi:acetyltransferase-like isoleucine patch superfamily enzyme
MFKKVKTIFYFLCTQLFYKPFFITAGKRIIIRRPILITPHCLKVGAYVHIRDFARLEGVHKYEGILFNPVIEINNYVSIEQNLHLTCAKKITIGQNTAIAANVTITDINHPYENILLPTEKQQIEVSEVEIGEDCKIYNNAVLLAGTKLGKHCVIAANAVVSGTYPDFSVIAGNPARIIRKYDPRKQQWA